MASVKVWRARRAVHPDADLDSPGSRLLCGWHFGVNYCAGPPIAWIIGDLQPEVLIGVPAGLTDAGTPGRYRWSRAATQKLADGREPGAWTNDGLHGPMIDRKTGQRYSLSINRPLPIFVPCTKNHANVIDPVVLAG